MSNSFDFGRLNPAQKQAVQTIKGPVLILAGAGTGKTSTVTTRIAYMVHQGVSPRSILALTFTNKAANEMAERAATLVSRSAAREMTISTFHSLCVRILREDIEQLGYKKNFSIYTGSDQSGLLREIILRNGGLHEKVKPAMVLSELSRVRNNSGAIADIEDDFMSRVAGDYLKEIRAQNAVDFDDLLILAEKLLTTNLEIRDKWRRRFNFITVDEFQDTNSLQMSLLRQLVGPDHNVCVVGDDDQSIYGWRGAQISNILDFESFFANPTVIKLEENYRCAAPILEVANALIRHNVGRRDKTLRASKIGGEDVSLISMPGFVEEAEFIAMDIETERLQRRCPWESFAILFRANTQSRVIEMTLREHRIPYRMVGAQSFFDRKEVKDLIAYLYVMTNPEADLHLLRILNTPRRGISEVTARSLIDWCREHACSAWLGLQNEEFQALCSTRTQNNIKSFVEILSKYLELFLASQRNFAQILDELMDEIKYEDHLRLGCKTNEEFEKRLGAISDVRQALLTFWQPGKNLVDFLAQMTLDPDNDEEDIENKSGVCLITMHAAKGLEFNTVYLVGLEEGILPHKRSLDDGNIDEERRLLYVGITRAQEKLTMSYCATRRRGSDIIRCDRSCFLNEIPAHLIECHTHDEVMNAVASEEETANFFNALRDLD